MRSFLTDTIIPNKAKSNGTINTVVSALSHEWQTQKQLETATGLTRRAVNRSLQYLRSMNRVEMMVPAADGQKKVGQKYRLGKRA